MDGLSRDGSISYSYAKAETYQKKALDSLDKLPSNDATDYLRTLTIELLRRKS
jgi:geranylgeranyl pyrophosphate synthase